MSVPVSQYLRQQMLEQITANKAQVDKMIVKYEDLVKSVETLSTIPNTESHVAGMVETLREMKDAIKGSLYRIGDLVKTYKDLSGQVFE